MSTEQSSTNKILIGCLIAGVFGVVLCTGAVVWLAYLGTATFKSFMEDVAPHIQNQVQRVQLAETWRAPPDDAGAEQLFPAAIGAWTLSGHDDAAAIPELAIERDGLHATYASAATTINVYAYRVPMAEQRDLFTAAEAAIDGAGYTVRYRENFDLDKAHWMPFNFRPPEKHGQMWWSRDWLIVAMTDSPAVDLEGFEEQYLYAIQPPLFPDASSSTPDDPATDAAAPAGVTPAEPAVTEPGSADAPTSEPVPAEPDSTESAPVESNTESQ